MKTRIENDERLQHAVLRELNCDLLLSSARIGVAASNGAVTLSGKVQTYAAKYAAEKTAQNVKGVESVLCAIEVKRATQPLSHGNRTQRAQRDEI